METDRVETQSVYLKVGELHMAETPTQIVTVLGSCVAVTMHHPPTGFGGMCHAMLPVSNEQQRSTRFVDVAIHSMLEWFSKRGIGPQALETYVFGGGEILNRAEGTTPLKFSVARQNIDTALDLLQKRGVPVMGGEVGGNLGRRLVMDTHTGRVLLHHNQH